MRAALPGALAVGVTVVVLAAGVFGPQPHSTGVRSDRLGPDSGESAAAYLARARDSLSANDALPRWGLISFDTELTLPQVVPLADGARIAQLLFRVPIPDMPTPLVTVLVSGHRDAVLDSVRQAAAVAMWPPFGTPAAIESATRLYHRNLSCRCLVALLVRTDPNRLRTIAGYPGIRAVQALPADAVAGHFGVSPLLPGF